MSLNLGIGGGRRTMLPGAAARHRSAGASFVACSGGLVSTSAGGGLKSRQFGGPPEKLSKESYASALEEQIAARKLQNAHNDVIVPPPMLKEAQPHSERVMGVRHGGPMAPSRPDSYASALRAQVKAREVLRAEEASAKVSGLHVQEEPLLGGAAQAPGIGRRCGAPLLPSKESYAVFLQEQMALRSAKQAAEAAKHDPIDFEDPVDDMFLGKGRRHGGPAVRPEKSLYAADLQHQIAAREAERAVDLDVPSSGFFGGNDALSEVLRGKRSKIEPVSKDALGVALQEQIAQRAAKRAAHAFHEQSPSGAEDATPRQAQESPKAGRRKIGLPEQSKECYALALKEQIAERRAHADDQRNTDAGRAQGSFFGGVASDNGPVRGRRRMEQMVPASKQEYRVDLQRQMAMRESEKAAVMFHAQAPPLPMGNSDVQRLADNTAEVDSLERLLGAHNDHASFAY